MCESLIALVVCFQQVCLHYDVLETCLINHTGTTFMPAVKVTNTLIGLCVLKIPLKFLSLTYPLSVTVLSQESWRLVAEPQISA